MSKTLITIIGISITFISTALGSSVIYLFKNKMDKRINSAILGFASGVMIAASLFGLILPAMEQASSWKDWAIVPVVIGFLLGALLLVIIDKIVPHMHKDEHEEGPTSNISKANKLFLAVTIHNIPEGLAVGVAFAGAIALGTTVAYLSALSLAIGIAIQNFPEGIAISVPIKEETNSNHKGFIYGMLSGIVEPIFAVIGLFIASITTSLMPWMLAFAAGAMIFVTIEDLIPDAKLSNNSHIGTWGFMLGFVVMMILESVLG